MVKLDRFDIFRTVVEAGSFAGAAQVLQQARAAVSFQIKQLEAELGVTLFTRTTRSVELTDAGERFYQRCLRVLAEAEEAIDEARQEHQGLQGTLRLTSSVDYGQMVVAPALHAFMQAHPQLQARLDTHGAPVDLVRERFDVAIRLGPHQQFENSPYRGACLGTYEVRAVLAPCLLAEAGLDRIESSDQLAGLPLLLPSRMAEPAHWDWQDAAGHKLAWGSAAKARVTADTASTLRAFARQGAGVALLPDWFVREDLANGSLIDALPALRFPPHAIYALYPHTRHVPKKTRCWVDFLKEYVRRHHASAGA